MWATFTTRLNARSKTFTFFGTLVVVGSHALQPAVSHLGLNAERVDNCVTGGWREEGEREKGRASSD
jgi:hypothetical protein